MLPPGLRRALLLIVLFIDCFFTVFIQYVLIVLTCLLPRPIRRKAHTYVEAMWVGCTGCYFPELTLVVTGDEMPTKKPIILIVNHQVDADWWFMWILGKAQGMHGHIKIILKASLKYVPIIGQGMANFEFIFLQRNWAEDRDVLSSRLMSFVRDKIPFWLLLFPEGTTIHKEAQDKGNEFAKKSNRPACKNCLVPRTTGFDAVLKAVGDSVDEVYDVTMCYSGFSGEVPEWNDGYDRKKDKDIPNLGKMLGGIQPKPVYLYIKRYNVKDITNEGVEKWLDARWAEKDTILQHFATTGKLPDHALANKRIIKDHGSPFLLATSVVGKVAILATVLYLFYYGFTLALFWR